MELPSPSANSVPHVHEFRSETAASERVGKALGDVPPTFGWEFEPKTEQIMFEGGSLSPQVQGWMNPF